MKKKLEKKKNYTLDHGLGLHVNKIKLTTIPASDTCLPDFHKAPWWQISKPHFENITDPVIFFQKECRVTFAGCIFIDLVCL